MAVVADVNSDLSEARAENRIAEVAGAEVVLLPETGQYLRDVNFAEFAEIGAVGVDHGRRVVIQAGLFLLVDRNHKHYAVLLGDRGHPLCGRAFSSTLGRLVPFRLLLGTEIGAIKQLLQAHDVRTAAGGLGDERLVLLNHCSLDFFDRRSRRLAKRRLNQATTNDPRHLKGLRKWLERVVFIVSSM